MKNTALAILSITTLTGCVTPSQWQANNYHDEFTNQNTCRVEIGDAKQREFGRALSGTYYSYNLYAENHDGEIRAGVRSEPAIPINGDVQIKIGDKLYTLTAADTPLDTKPSMPVPQGNEAFNKSYNAAMDSIQKYASPYRAFTGSKAKSLLYDIIQAGEEIKFRSIGVNAATSGTGSFTVDEHFITALKECGIIE
ncbi:MAG: hypothetical protein ACTHPO_11320 [Alphaproteobacteria bacterium]